MSGNHWNQPRRSRGGGRHETHDNRQSQDHYGPSRRWGGNYNQSHHQDGRNEMRFSHGSYNRDSRPNSRGFSPRNRDNYQRNDVGRRSFNSYKPAASSGAAGLKRPIPDIEKNNTLQQSIPRKLKPAATPETTINHDEEKEHANVEAPNAQLKEESSSEVDMTIAKMKEEVSHFDPERSLPMDAFFPETSQWKKQKEAACAKATENSLYLFKRLKALKERRDEETDDDDDFDDNDSNDSFGYGYGGSEVMGVVEMTEEQQLSKFVASLVDCVSFDRGFHIKFGNTNFCWCPCGKAMQNWREKCGVAFMDGCKNSLSEPKALMDHLQSMGERCLYHSATHSYLTHLYSNFFGQGVHHQALYGVNTKEYKLAGEFQAAKYRKERAECQRSMKLAMERAAEAESLLEKHQIENERLKTTNDDLQKKVQKLREDLHVLHVRDEKEAELGKDQLEVWRSVYQGMVSLLQFGVVKKVKKARCVLEVEQQFKVQDVFDELYAMSRRGKVASGVNPLFEADPDDKFLEQWLVQFKAHNMLDTKKKQRENAAVDEGGPTKEFFSQVWRQMGQVCVPSGDDGKNNIKLFEESSSGYVPMTDAKIEMGIQVAVGSGRNRARERLRLLNKIEAYYTAFGRLFHRAIVCQLTIASSALPKFFRNVILRGCEPKHKGRYFDKDLATQLQEIDLWPTEGVKECILGKTLGSFGYDLEVDEVITEENFFTHYLQSVAVDSRSTSIKAIRKGFDLTYDEADCEGGKVEVNITNQLANIPLDAISKIMFSRLHIGADDAMNMTEVKYSKGPQSEIQKEFVEQVLPKVFASLEQDDKLTDFIYFCTGSWFVPQYDGNSKFSIRIEFTRDSSEALPVVHTCENCISLPQQVYHLDVDLFEHKLRTAMEATAGAYSRH